jgi:ligand-binding sensor domain-containing protein/signal transduction histidine kinase
MLSVGSRQFWLGCFQRTLLMLILCGSYNYLTFAVDPYKGLSQYSYEMWQAREGLPHGLIRNITQSSDRYIWISTEMGLVQFDGIKFKLFSSKNVEKMTYWGVGPVYSSPDGILWFGDSNQLFKRDPSGTITLSGFQFPQEIKYQHTLTGIVKDNQGSLWVSHAGAGIFRITDGTVSHFTKQHGLPSDVILALAKDKDDRIWVGTNNGAAVFDNEKFISFTNIDSHISPHVTRVFTTHEGIVWLKVNGKLFQYQSGQFKTWVMQSQLPEVTSMCQDKDNNLWLGTDAGLYRYRNGKLSNTKDHNLLPDNSISALYEDIEGNIWVGTRRGGLIVIRDPKLTSFSVSEGLPNDYVNAIHEDENGSLWVGTRDGLAHLFEGNVTVHTTKNGLMSNNIKSLWRDRNGRLWVGTAGQGIHYFENNRWHLIGQQIKGVHNIITISETQDGTLWFGSSDERKLFYWQSGQLVDYGQSRNLEDLYIQALLPDKDGNLWVGTRRGLFYITNGVMSSSFEGIKLPEIGIRSLYKDSDGNLWIGTSSNGLYSIRNGKIFSYQERNGLLDDGITQIIEDLAGNLWLGSRVGIFSIKKQDFDAFDQGTISKLSYSTYDSWGRNWKCMLDARYTGRKGPLSKLYFPSDRGIIIIDTQKLGSSSPPPVIHIEEVIANNSAFINPYDLVVPPNRGDVEIHYTGLSFIAPPKITFKYRLEGFDKEWVEAGNRRVAFYTQLPPGSYKFHVMAANADGVWNQQSASMSLHIKPHFYQTYTFYILCLFLLIGIIWVIYLWRLRQMKTRFRAILDERFRIARELHDTLAQGLAGVAMQLNVATTKFHRAPAASLNHLQLARQMVQHSQEEIRHCIFDLRSSDLEDGNLVLNLLSLAERIKSTEQLNVNLEVLGTPYSLPKIVENNILRIAQEALINSKKHSKAIQVDVILTFHPRNIELIIKDDGTGFNAQHVPDQAEGHFGIIGMRERAERIGGTIKIESRECSGTSVILSVERIL